MRPHEYTTVVENGITLMKGPVGGGCAMTSRELHDRVGGFKQDKKHVFWLEDAAYIADIEKLGFEAAFLKDLEVHHAGGPYYTPFGAEKQRFWDDFFATQRRKDTVKTALLRVPFVRQLNARRGWFTPPA
jgi:GT2 family glycosyltransferase